MHKVPQLQDMFVITDLLSDLMVILLDHSVQQEASHAQIHPRTFTAGAVVIWITVGKKQSVNMRLTQSKKLNDPH